MPEWAARSHALIVSVRPERIQEITFQDLEREGFSGELNAASSEFIGIWESLHPGSWERNDWVWRIELEKQ